jgi:hypothetical protein
MGIHTKHITRTIFRLRATSVDTSQLLRTTCWSPVVARDVLHIKEWREFSYFVTYTQVDFSCCHWNEVTMTVAAIQWRPELLLPPWESSTFSQ